MELPRLKLNAVAVCWCLALPFIAACGNPRPVPLVTATAERPEREPAKQGAEPRRLFADPTNFERLPPPSANRWRGLVDEPQQTYVDYLATVPRRPGPGRDTLFLLPLGELETALVVEDASVHLIRTPTPATMAQFIATFFATPTEVLPTRAIDSLLDPERIHAGREQYRVQDILDATRSLQPAHAYSMTALTAHDVYFDAAQRYGLGFGQHRDGGAVVSFARLGSDHILAGNVEDRTPLISLRSLKLLAHEVGHTFGFEHCGEYRCVMNGIADVDELDETPLYLGPHCLQKLIHATAADPAKRYAELAALYSGLGLQQPANWIRSRQRWLLETGS